MSDKLHIAVDLDDVVLDFQQGILDSMYREFGVILLKSDITTWTQGEGPHAIKDFDWQAYGYKDWWQWLRARDWLWAVFPAVPGAIGALHALRSQGHHIECLTGKPEWAEPQVWRWLGRWRPDFQSVILTNVDQPKHEASQADILVDDRPSNIEGWVASADDRFGILYSQPWNDGVDLGERTSRAADWHQVLHIVSLFEEVG